MKAPSEKHLEDWIVNNLPYFGEQSEPDYFPDYYLEGLPRVGNEVVFPFIVRIIKRQMRFPFGIADLIARVSNGIAAVEIKKGLITADTVIQCLRYMHELRNIWNANFFYVCSQFDGEARNHYLYPLQHDPFVSSYPSNEISGMVVGHGVADSNLLLVCNVCQIQVVTYKYDGNGYIFTHEQFSSYEEDQSYNDYVIGALGEAMREIMVERAAQAKRRSEQ